nr:LysE family transporter [Breoghania sp.]
MRLLYFITGIGIGLIVSAPVGPVNLMTIQRALMQGFRPALAAGVGAVFADTLYAAVAAFGVSTVTHFLADHRLAIQAIGGVLLIGFGLVTLRSHPHIDRFEVTRGVSRPGATSGKGILPSMLAAFVMTLTNPGAVLGFLAIFGSLGDWAPPRHDTLGAVILVSGVALGAFVWWTGLAAFVRIVRDKLTDHWLEAINLAAGALLTIFGSVILVRALLELLF